MSVLTAHDKFRKGQGVRLSKECPPGIQPSAHRLTRRGSTGVVVGFGREPHIVRVLPDGIKTVSAYHIDFWEPVETTEAAR